MEDAQFLTRNLQRSGRSYLKSIVGATFLPPQSTHPKCGVRSSPSQRWDIGEQRVRKENLHLNKQCEARSLKMLWGSILLSP